MFGTAVDPYERYQPDYVQSSASRRADPLIPATELDRLWLRCTVSILGAIGLALIAVSTATYLLAVDKETLAWVALGWPRSSRWRCRRSRCSTCASCAPRWTRQKPPSETTRAGDARETTEPPSLAARGFRRFRIL